MNPIIIKNNKTDKTFIVLQIPDNSKGFWLVARTFTGKMFRVSDTKIRESFSYFKQMEVK